MYMADNKDKKEIVSFNKLADFNFDDVNVEELERRLELAIAPLVSSFFDCTDFTGNCQGFGGNCTRFGPIQPQVPSDS
jgi:hypothetical protein